MARRHQEGGRGKKRKEKRGKNERKEEKKGRKEERKRREEKRRKEKGREYGGGRMGMGKSERLMVDGVETDRTGTLYGARAHPVGPLPFFIIF